MAIIFISPKAKQKSFLKMFIIGSTAVVIILVLMAAILWLININQGMVSANPVSPDLSVNLKVLDSDTVKNLQSFADLEVQFSYVVHDKDDKQIEGTISAINQSTAKSLLEASGFKVLILKEVVQGRSEPFTAY
jgi:hypothetical protein